MSGIKLLFIGGAPIRPVSQPLEKLKHEYFSKYFSGDIITCVSNAKQKEIKEIGRFQFHPVIVSGGAIIKNIKILMSYLYTSFRLFREYRGYDVIIANNPLLTGMIALMIGKITNTRVVVEVNGNFEAAFKYNEPGKDYSALLDRIKEKISMFLIPFVLKNVDMIKLLSDNQLVPYNLDRDLIDVRYFSDFVPVQKFVESPKNDLKYILLLGYPWYLKGVDILIEAFNMISHEFTDYRLKIFGWCPEGKEYFQELVNDNPRIELNDPVYYDDVISIMSNCSIYVLASRTEAMGRVLIEAMACQKPIIASDVGGVYSVIKDGYNGLLFEKENVNDLAGKLRYLLLHPDVADSLASNGLSEAMLRLSEEGYINNYRNMIYDVLSPVKN